MRSVKDEQKAAADFVAMWQAKEDTEDQLSRSFWLDLLQNVLGDTNALAPTFQSRNKMPTEKPTNA